MSNLPVQNPQGKSEQTVQPVQQQFTVPGNQFIQGIPGILQPGVNITQNAGFAGQPSFLTQGYQARGVLTQPTVVQGATTGFVGQTAFLPPAVPQSTQVVTGQSQIFGQSELAASYTGQTIKGESRIEYIPYEKSFIEYEEVRRQIQVPVTRQITDYQVVQYDIEYIPNVIQEKEIQYMPVERIAERVEYQAIQRQNILSYPSQTVQTAQTIVQQPVVQQQAYTVVQQPVVQQSYATTGIQQPIVSQTVVQQQGFTPQMIVSPQVAYSAQYQTGYTQLPPQFAQSAIQGQAFSGSAFTQQFGQTTTQLLPGQQFQATQSNTVKGTTLTEGQAGTLNQQGKITPQQLQPQSQTQNNQKPVEQIIYIILISKKKEISLTDYLNEIIKQQIIEINIIIIQLDYINQLLIQIKHFISIYLKYFIDNQFQDNWKQNLIKGNLTKILIIGRDYFISIVRRRIVKRSILFDC